MANRRLQNNHESCDCSVYRFCDKPVQTGLAMTPARVRELTAKGIAVTLSAPDPSSFTGSPEKGNFDVDPLYQRGMDQNILWERSETSRRNILKSRDKLTKEQRQLKSKSK